MAARAGLWLIAAAVIALAVFLGLRAWSGDERAGMTATPCAANGGPASGSASDDWARLCAYRRANAELLEEGAAPEIVMIGDSITAFWPDGDKSIVNRGIAGQTSAQVLLRFRQDAVALRPRIVHILVGINDVAGNSGQVSPDMFANNVAAMVEQAEAHDISVIVGTIPPARAFEWAPDADPGHWVPILNRWLTRHASDNGLILADYHTVLTDKQGRIREKLFRDGLHPNNEGYAAMTRVLEAAIEQAKTRRAKSSPISPRSGV